MELRDCIVLLGPELEPWACARVVVEEGSFAVIDAIEPRTRLAGEGAMVLCPGFYNAHTHLGDSVAPDGATGLTLAQGFFRPAGYKYRMLAQQTAATQQRALEDHLRYLARTGSVGHFDFREQGHYGARLLRAASEATGVASVILGQFDGVPFDSAALDANTAALPAAFRGELEHLLSVADGFSESTMNDLTDPAWREVRAITTQAGKYRAIHCLEDASYRGTSLTRTGRGDLIRALDLYDPHLVVHLTVANDEEIALLAARRVTAVLNPRANANLGLPLPPIARLLDAGVNLLLGTDNGLLNSPNMLAELDFTYKVAKSQYGDAVRPEPRQILQLATANVRKVFGGRFSGVIEPGGPADYFIADYRAGHLRASQHVVASLLTRVTPEDIRGTWRGGRRLYGEE